MTYQELLTVLFDRMDPTTLNRWIISNWINLKRHPVEPVKHDNNDENVSENVREVNPQGTFALDLTYHFHQTQLWNLFFRQGNDRGTQYRSGIYYHSEEQKVVATIFFLKTLPLTRKCSPKYFSHYSTSYYIISLPSYLFCSKMCFPDDRPELHQGGTG